MGACRATSHTIPFDEATMTSTGSKPAGGNLETIASAARLAASGAHKEGGDFLFTTGLPPGLADSLRASSQEIAISSEVDWREQAHVGQERFDEG
jgi:hypothetical protein